MLSPTTVVAQPSLAIGGVQAGSLAIGGSIQAGSMFIGPTVTTTTTTTPDPTQQVYEVRGRLAFYVSTYFRDCSDPKCEFARECWPYAASWGPNVPGPLPSFVPTASRLSTQTSPHPRIYCPPRGPEFFLSKGGATNYARPVAFLPEPDAAVNDWTPPVITPVTFNSFPFRYTFKTVVEKVLDGSQIVDLMGNTLLFDKPVSGSTDVNVEIVRAVTPYFDLLNGGKRTSPLPSAMYFGGSYAGDENNYTDLERFVEVDFTVGGLGYEDVKRTSYALTDASESNSPGVGMAGVGLGRRFAAAMESAYTKAFLEQGLLISGRTFYERGNYRSVSRSLLRLTTEELPHSVGLWLRCICVGKRGLLVVCVVEGSRSQLSVTKEGPSTTSGGVSWEGSRGRRAGLEGSYYSRVGYLRGVAVVWLELSPGMASRGTCPGERVGGCCCCLPHGGRLCCL